MRRLGLVGVGAWGRRYIDTVGRRLDCRIVAFSRARSGDDFSLAGAEPCPSWRDLVERGRVGELDGVIVATTPDNQAEVAAAAVTAGVPGLIEKPLGMSPTTAAGVLARAREAQRRPPLVVNHVHLWAPAYRALVALVQESGGPAEVSTIESEGCSRGPFRSWCSLHDYGPHDLAMGLGLMGIDARFVLEWARRIPSTEDPQGELFEARFQLGSARINLRVGNGAASKRRRFAVTLRDGRTLIYDDLLPHPHKLTDAGRPVPVGETMPLDAVVTDFLQQIQQWQAGALPQPTALASLELSERIATMVDAIAANA